MKPKKSFKDPKSPCCNKEMIHEPDNIHFHYMCPRCGNEFELDGKTERVNAKYVVKIKYSPPEQAMQHALKSKSNKRDGRVGI